MVLPHLTGGGVPAPSPHTLLTDFGFSLFPVADKVPAVKSWTAFQERLATAETLTAWQRTGSDFGLATGPVSGVVVVDTDTQEAEQWAEANLPPTPWVVLTGIKDEATGFRGRHRYYRYPTHTDRPIGNRASIEVGNLRRRIVTTLDGKQKKVGTGLDLRAQGGYVVAPGSSHPSGVRYDVTNEWRPEDPLPVFNPDWFEERERPREVAPTAPRPVERTRPTAYAYENAQKWLSKKDTPYDGERNHTCYSAACSLFDFGLSHSDVLGLMLDWNRTFSNPLEESELQRTVGSAESNRQPAQHPKGTKVGTGGRQVSGSGGGADDVGELEPEEWGDIQPIQANALPAFPLEVFAPWARDYLEAITRTLQTPPDFAGMFFLGGLALAFQKRFRLTVKPGWEEPLPLWILLAAPSGSKKSQAFRLTMMPFNNWQRWMKEEFASVRRDAARRIKTLTAEIEEAKKRKTPALSIADKEEELAELFIPSTPRLFTGSGTPEAIETKLEEHFGRYALASAESDILSVLMGKYRSGGSPPIEGFLSGWSGEDLRNDFRTRDDVDVTEAHLSMVLATQPENAADLYAQQKLGGRGAFGRFLTVLPATEDGDEWTTERVPSQVENAYLDGVGKLLPSFEETASLYCDRRKVEPVDLCFGPEALALFRLFFERIQARRKVGGDLQFLEEWSAKVCGQCARIAALLHLSDRPEEKPDPQVSESAVERAVYLTERYLIPHAKAVFGTAVTQQTEKVWSILQGLRPEVKRKTLYRAVKPMSAEELTGILEELEERNCIRVEKRPSTGGKPPTFIVVNPMAPKSLGTKGTKGTKSLEPGFKPFADEKPLGTKWALSGALSPPDTKDPTLCRLSTQGKTKSEAHNHGGNRLSTLCTLSAQGSEPELQDVDLDSLI